jgi:hypothetical protein
LSLFVWKTLHIVAVAMNISANLLGRAPHGWLRERDIDLLLCAELHVTSGRFSGAWVSEADADGESDLVLASDGDGGHLIALIQNKVAAAFLR